MSLYTMKLSDSVDTMEFNLLEVPIQDKDIEGAVDNVVLSGDIYTDFLWLKKRFTHKWSILCKDDYERLRGFYTRQFSNAEVPIYQLLDAPSPIEESAGSGEYIQITTTDSTAKLASVEMLGKAEQTTYSGKNKLNYLDAVPATNQTTTTFIDNGFRSVTTSTGYATKITLSVKASTTYTLSWTVKKVSGTMSPFVRVYEGTGTSTQIMYVSSASDGTYNGSFTTASGVTQVNIWFYNGTPAQGTTEWTFIQLEESATKTDYEPYVGGTASPNPDYPQPILVVTGEQTVKITRKNLWDVMTPYRTGGSFYNIAVGTQIVAGQSPDVSISKALDGYTITVGAWQGAIFVIPLEVGTTYHLKYTLTSTSNRLTRYTLDANHTIVRRLGNLTNAPISEDINISLENGETYYAIAIGSNQAITLTLTEPQLELGSQASDYQPYQAQKYEIDLGNLVSESMFEMGAMTNGSFQASSSRITNAKLPITVKPSTTYTLSVKLGSTVMGFRVGIHECKADGTFIRDLGWKQIGTTPYTFTTGADCYNIKFVCSLSTTSANVTTGGSESTIAYTSVISWLRGCELQFNVGDAVITPIELAKVGDYQDRIYKTDGKWYIEKQVGKVVLDGSENWYRATSSGGYFQLDDSFGSMPFSGNPATNGLCDHFICRPRWYVVSSTEFNLSINLSGSLTAIRYDAITDLADFKTWLASNPTTVYYALATPTTTEITNEALIAQLDALGASSLYVGVNNIGTETQNAMPTLALTYFPYYPHEIISPKAVRMELTDGGIINACECRENVQITLRETIQ